MTDSGLQRVVCMVNEKIPVGNYVTKDSKRMPYKYQLKVAMV